MKKLMTYKRCFALYLLILCACFFYIPHAKSQTLSEIDHSAAIILAYHRIGEDYIPEENLRIEQFSQQIQILIEDDYKIISLDQILYSYKNKVPLPPKTVAITFDGGYKSILHEAVPLLEKHNIPFTVFYASENADANNNQFLNWTDLRTLSQSPHVTLGVTPASYASLITSSRSELLSQLNKSKIAFREHFYKEPLYFSYPYGEYSSEYKKIIENQGYSAAFGLQSGVSSLQTDFYALPRFSITEKYGDADHFKTILNALPFPVSDLRPRTPDIKQATPSIGFTVHKDLVNDLDLLSCFASGQNSPKIEVIGSDHVEIRLAAPLQNDNKIRLNCTLPVQDHLSDEEKIMPHWRWLGMILIYAPQ